MIMIFVSHIYFPLRRRPDHLSVSELPSPQQFRSKRIVKCHEGRIGDRVPSIHELAKVQCGEDARSRLIERTTFQIIIFAMKRQSHPTVLSLSLSLILGLSGVIVNRSNAYLISVRLRVPIAICLEPFVVASILSSHLLDRSIS